MRFSLAKLMMLVTILSVTGAALSYLAQTLHAPQASDLRFVLFCVIAPPVTLVVTSLIYLALTRLQTRRRRSVPGNHGAVAINATTGVARNSEPPWRRKAGQI